MLISDNFNLYQEYFSNNSMPIYILLKDHTTNRNIIWATDDYAKFGEQYAAEVEITPNAIIRFHTNIVQPRVEKTNDSQSNRTRDRAEVFTPAWICNAQNNLIDEQWFGRPNVFNVADNQSWQSIENKIEFTNLANRSWQDYVDARRLEISCGEAPYLVSRYDTVTGGEISLMQRIGLLDRKMRIVNENTAKKTDWLKWAQRAFEAVYGYEYQGDSLFLARENLFYTFIDNYYYKFEEMPDNKELDKIANIISWNIWQMDGLTYCVPYSDKKVQSEQQALFDCSLLDGTWGSSESYIIKAETAGEYCKIRDWRSKKTQTFISMLKGGK